MRLLILSFLIFISDFSYSASIGEACPLGHRNAQYSGANSAKSCANFYIPDSTQDTMYFLHTEPHPTRDDLTNCYMVTLSRKDCASPEDMLPNPQGCYPSDGDGTDAGNPCLKECGVQANGEPNYIGFSRTCEITDGTDGGTSNGPDHSQDYDGDGVNDKYNDELKCGQFTDTPHFNPLIQKCMPLPVGCNNGGYSPEGRYMCDDGVVNADGTVTLPDGSIVDTSGNPVSSDGGTGAGTGTDTGTGGQEVQGCESESVCYSEALAGTQCNLDRDNFVFNFISQGNYTSDCQSCAGPNSANYSECSNEPVPTGCADYSSCRAEALQSSNCRENDRDYFAFQFIAQGDYSADCQTCMGPNSMSYTECQTASCQYGYDSVSGNCWTIDCPHGDCVDPQAPQSQAEAPPQNQDNSNERLSEIITAINEVKRAVDNDETPQKVDQLRIEVSEKITRQTQELIKSEDENTKKLVDTLTLVKDKISENKPGTEIDYTALLTKIEKHTKDTKCALDPSAEGCTATIPIDRPDTDKAATDLVAGVQNSGIYTALSQFQNITINVSSQCPSTFRYSLEFMGTHTVDVCEIFDPIVPLIRTLFIAFWGLVSFRALTDA